MALYHHKLNHISRSTGRSAVQHAAYITGTRLVESRRQIVANYKNRNMEIVYATYAPDHVPEWAKSLEVWDRLETFEDTYADKHFKSLRTKEQYLSSARSSATLTLALQRELTHDQNLEVVQEFVQKEFVERGLIVLAALHYDEGNPHVHLQISRRSINEDGEISWRKNREITTPGFLKQNRAVWGDLNNLALERAGFDVRIDHRSFAERGLDLIPTKHEGYYAHKLDEQGQESRLIQENEEIQEQNRERIAQFPELILKELTSKQSTFTELALLRLTQQRLTDQPELVGHVYEQTLQSSLFVGEDLAGQKRYTSSEYAQKEAQLFADLNHLCRQKSFLEIYSQKVEEALERKFAYLNAEQKDAVRVLCANTSFALMIGRAGTGKTTALKPVVELHKEAGYQIFGMALAASAAQNLGQDTGCSSETIAFYLHKWRSYEETKKALYLCTDELEHKRLQHILKDLEKYKLTSKHLLLVDEAAMVGTTQWSQLTEQAKRVGAKILAAGDNHQFKAIDAGDCARRLEEIAFETHRTCELKSIIRQKKDWMREATTHLAELNTATALASYENQGHITVGKNLEELKQLMAQSDVHRLLQEPLQTGLVLAYTREECAALNEAIRQKLRQQGLLSSEDKLVFKNKGYALGDRLVFLENERSQKKVCPVEDNSSFFVKNGTYGILENVEKLIKVNPDPTFPPHITHRLTVRVEENNKSHTVKFILDDYTAFDHAYAVTQHKSQGQTVDWSLLLASRYMDAYATYVALTRHRQEVQLYYSQEEFPDFAALQRTLSKINGKDLVLDYSITDSHKEYWVNVQDYKILGQEMARSLKDLSRGEKAPQEDWQAFEETKKERLELARLILEDWEQHKNFVRQAGLTKETLEFAAQYKQRPLSLAEQRAQLTVEQYALTAQLCREHWQIIRQSHPGARAVLHPDYKAFNILREERGELANRIALSPTLHRPFIKEVSAALGYGLPTIQKQADDYQEKALLKVNLKFLSSEEQKRFEVLSSYIQERNLTAQAWHEIKELKDDYKDAVVPPNLKKPLKDYQQHQEQRDHLAFTITNELEQYQELSSKLNLAALPLEKMLNQADQHYRRELILQVQASDSLLVQGLAASELYSLWQEEKALGGKQVIYASLKEAGLNLTEIHKQTLKFERYLISTELHTEQERTLFKHLETYAALKDTLRQHYKVCAEDAQEKDLKVWESDYYPVLKEISQERDQTASLILKEPSPLLSSLASRLEISLDQLDEQAHAHEMRSLAERFTTTESVLEKSVIGQELGDWLSLEKETQQRITVRALLDAGIEWKDLRQAQRTYDHLSYRDSLSPQEQQAFDRVYRYTELRRECGILFGMVAQESEDMKIDKKPLAPWKTPSYEQFWQSRKAMNACAAEIQEQLLEHKPFFERFKVIEKSLDRQSHRHDLERLVSFFKEQDERVQYFAGHELKEWLNFEPALKSNDALATLLQNGVQPASLEEELKEIEERKKLYASVPETAKESKDVSFPLQSQKKLSPSLSFEDVEGRLKERLPELASSLLGEPTAKGGAQWRYGKKGSLCLMMAGPRKGLLSDFADDRHGGVFYLIERQLNLKGKEALKWAQDWLGETPSLVKVIDQQTPLIKEDTKGAEWKPILPVPSGTPTPDLIGNRFLSYMLTNRQEKTRFAYRDQQGKLLGYVVRLEDKEGNKITPTLTYCENDKGQRYWRWQGFGENRPLYGLDRLYPEKPVLIVEGEKAADAAQKLFPDYAVLSWPGGSGATNKADWSPLKGHDVVIWPDHDEPGYKAANKITHRLTEIGAKSIATVNLPSQTPEKWDLADSLPQGWSLDTLKGMITSASSQQKKEEQNHLEVFQKLLKEKEAKPFTIYLSPEEKKQYHALSTRIDEIAYQIYQQPETVLAAEKLGLGKALKNAYQGYQRTQREAQELALGINQGRGLSY